MAILTASYLGQSFGAVDLFGGVSVSIPQDGKIGLVGPNGVGKTSLLLILAGISQPASGSVHLARGARLGYLPQEAAQAFAGKGRTVFSEMLGVFQPLLAEEERLRRLEAQMASEPFSESLTQSYSKLQLQFELAGGYDYELRIKQVLTGLGFDQNGWALPLDHLSGGQKTRALLARLLLEKPDLLILDEPTNHLDVEAIQWLEGTLRMWQGAVLLVSHDRYFLDRFSSTIWEMSPSGIEKYRGNYTAYVRQREERWQRRRREFVALKDRMDKEMDFIRRNISGQRTQMAQGKLSRLGREVEAVHAGGMDVLHTFKSKGWLQLSTEFNLKRPPSTISGLQERINQLRDPVQPLTLKMELHAAHRSGNIVLRTKGLQIGYPGTPLFEADDIELRRREYAALIGPNGSGKTTFLRALLGLMEPLAGEILLGASLQVGYFAQAHDGLNLENRLLDELLVHRHMNISEARSYLARFLFRQDDVYKRVKDLSGGERGRLALAILTLQGANFLLLDEPTNHLDIPAQEELQSALERFQGTVLLVSHDRYLANRLATQIWEIRDGHLHLHQGSYQEYLVQRAREKEALKETAASKNAASRDPVDSGGIELSKNARRKQAEDLEFIESLIEETEGELHRLGEAIQVASRAQSFDKIQSLSVEYAAAETQLVDLLKQWENLDHE